MTSKHDWEHDLAPEALPDDPRRISRRRFLEIATAAAAGMVIASCTPGRTPMPGAEAAPTDGLPSATSVPTGVATATEAPPTSTPAATSTSAAEAAAATAAEPTVGATATVEAATAEPAATATPAGLANRVAIGKAGSYDPQLIYITLRDMLDDIGGLGDIVRPGDRVALKTNLTGGLGNQGPAGLTAMESFVTHPEVVRALGKLVLDAGAAQLFIVEAVYQWGSYTEWGYEEVARDIGATLIDLNSPEPYGDFVNVSVPGGGSGLYETYIFNPLLTELDAFMSVAKMKCHWTAGVTHSLKNLIGLVPAQFYHLRAQDNNRSEFHGPSDETAGHRVPRIIVDLNLAHPIDLAVIDGVMTTEGGEGPWLPTFGPIAPGVLFAGKDSVATDAVATAAQGFDPTAPGMKVPFVRSDNYLNLAAAAGLGTNRLSEIHTVGAALEEVQTPFKPCVVGG
ncbi:MAG: DUF362 domain-containing protein [Anaerolineae bacterium]